MLGKISILIILYLAILACDLPKLKKSKLPELISYCMFMLISVYLGLDYVMNKQWPNTISLINALLAKPAKFIFEMLQVPS